MLSISPAPVFVMAGRVGFALGRVSAVANTRLGAGPRGASSLLSHRSGRSNPTILL